MSDVDTTDWEHLRPSPGQSIQQFYAHLDAEAVKYSLPRPIKRVHSSPVGVVAHPDLVHRFMAPDEALQTVNRPAVEEAALSVAEATVQGVSVEDTSAVEVEKPKKRKKRKKTVDAEEEN